MNIDGGIALNLLESGRSSLSVQQAIRILRAERRQMQQDLSEAQELSRIREAQIKEELDCISSFQQQLQDKERNLVGMIREWKKEVGYNKKLSAKLQTQEEKNRKMRGLLTDLQWQPVIHDGLEFKRCPVCLAYNNQEHKSDCALRQALEDTLGHEGREIMLTTEELLTWVDMHGIPNSAPGKALRSILAERQQLQRQNSALRIELNAAYDELRSKTLRQYRKQRSGSIKSKGG